MGKIVDVAIDSLIALAGGAIGYVLGTRGKVTVSFIYVIGHPKGYTPEMLVCEETRRAVWIEDPDTSNMLKYIFNYTVPVRSMRYEDFIATYEVITPGQLLWNKTAPSF